MESPVLIEKPFRLGPGLLSTAYQMANCTAARASGVLWSCVSSQPIRLSTSEKVLLPKPMLGTCVIV